MNRTNRRFSGAERSIWRLLCLGLVFLLLMPAAFAFVQPDGESAFAPLRYGDNYSAVLYNNTNGLPTSEANDIVQTAEGFLWIGSYSGLIRYDGSTFERMDSTRGLVSVVSLFVDSRDRLWIGTNDNGAAVMERGEFRMWDEDDGLGSSKICAFEEDRDGTIYVGTTAGITMISPDLELSAVDDPKIANAYIEQMARGCDGLIYCITNEDDFFTLRDGKLVEYIDHDETSIQGITSILPDPHIPGELYIGTERSGFYHGNPKNSLGAIEHVDIAPLFSVIGIREIDNQVWICANNGIGVVDLDGFHCLSDLPMNNSVSHVISDYEGNLWFTSSRQGVMKLVRNRFSDVFARYDLEPRVVNSTCKLGDLLYIATDTGLAVLDENEPVTAIPLTSAKTASGEDLGQTDLIEMLDGCRIRSVLPDSQGRLWVSTWRGCGLLRYDRGAVVAFTEDDGLLSDHIRAVCETADGKILVANTGGVSVIEGDRVTASYGENDGIDNQESLTVCAAPNGDILVGSNGGGIYVISGESLRCINRKDGMTSGIVMRIKHDPERHLFWIITSNSVAYMTEDYQVTTVQNFPYSNNFDLYENSKGDLWVLSSNGINVVPSEEMIANGAIKPVHYGMANGLPCITTSNSYSALTEDGDLYIAGNTGVAKVNIEEPMEDVRNVKQAVPYLEADGKLVYPDAKGGFTIPSGVQKLTVYPYVYNYSLTDPMVSYRLEGFDQQPVTVSRSELGPVTYTNLRGGSYRFVMELTDALGRGSKELSVSIIKEKALYEQAWFYGVIGSGGLAGLWAFSRAIFRRKMKALEKQHREEAERERIGSELQMATQIQTDMLPHDFPAFPERTEFDLYARMEPAREVGGDFYDFYLIDDDHLCLVMADVSGKGIPAALFMMVSKSILKSVAIMSPSPAEILARTNEMLCSNEQVDMFVTVWMGILEISTGRLIAANAGHEYPILKRANGQYELIRDKHGLVLGGMSGIRYREYELQLSVGDKLFLYTDGVPEATDAEMHMFGTNHMLDALNADADASPRAVLKNMRQAVDAFVQDAEQFDDLTMLCMEYRGPQ